MLSRLRRFLHSDKSKSGDQDTGTRMPFITGSQPWLKPYMLAVLAHPPQPPSLNAHYLQAISPVSSRRELTVYDGRFIIPAVLSQAAASLLDADEDDTGVTTRNLLGHVLAPVSVIVVPDMTTTPPTATLLIKEIRVFADRIHQRPVGRVPFVYTDVEVCDALRAIVGRQLASYATATVLERADRATQVPGESTQETATFFEKLLTDPSIPPPGLLSESEPFVMNARRGVVVGGGVAADDEHEPLSIIPENPTPSDGDKSKDLQESSAPRDSQSNQRDVEWEISFTQDPEEGLNNVGGDLPQTQHFAVDEDDDDDDDDDNDGGEDENMKENNTDTPKDDEIDQLTPDRGKSVGEQRIQEIVGNAQDDTLDGQDLSQAAKPRDPTASQSPRPADGTSMDQKSPVTYPKRTSRGGEETTARVVQKGVRTPPRRKRGKVAQIASVNPTEQIPESPRTRETSGAQKITIEVGAEAEGSPGAPKPSESLKRFPKQCVTPVNPKESMPAMSRSKENRMVTARGVDEMEGAREEKTLSENKRVQDSPGLVKRTAGKGFTFRAADKAKEGPQTSTPKTSKANVPSTELAKRRRSPRAVEMKTPPRRPRNAPKLPEESSKDEGMKGSPETPLRRSPRHLVQKSPSQGSPLRNPHSPLRRSPRVAGNVLTYAEGEGDEEESEEGIEYRDDEKENSEDRDDKYRRKPTRRSKLAKEKAALGEKQLHGPESSPRRSPRIAGNVLSYDREDSEEESVDIEESEEDNDHRDEEFHLRPARGPNDDKEKSRLIGKGLPSSDNVEKEGGDEPRIQGKKAMSENVPAHTKALTPERMREDRGRKRKAPDVSLPTDVGSKKRPEIEQPQSHSPEPFLDKLKAEIAEMKRFRDNIDRNPDAFKAYPDGFLPSAKPARESVRRVLKFPPPTRPVNQPIDVPESAPM